jgi:type I restriction enzyme S subunit
MKRYDSYRPSGVDWLGEVPAHWEILPFKSLFKMSTEKNDKNIVGEMLSVSGYRGIEVKQYEFEEQKRTEKELRDYRVVRPGQLVVNTMWLNYAGLGVSSYEGHVSPAYRAYRFASRLRPKYAHYLLRSHPYIQGYTGKMQGIRPNSLQIKNCDFNKIPVLVPPESEQDRIVKFLNQKTAEINAAIAKKQWLIELLQEQKSILINQAVTRGLNPNVPMRDSRVEWIGEIPIHWKIVPLKHISIVQSGVTLGKSYSQSRNNRYFPYLRVANVQNGFLDMSEITEITLPIREAKNYLLKKGDILVTEGGDIDKLGRGTCWNGEIEECLHQNHVFAVRIIRDATPEFVSLITGVEYARRYFTTTANKTTNLASTNKTKLGNLPLVVPPMTEQAQILSYSAGVRARFDVLVSKATREREVLEEMKATLIAEAVTGNIKI